jgi:hypothetical protein
MSQTVDYVDSMDVLGANVMVGTYPDGSKELAIWGICPVNARDAVTTQPRLVPKEDRE